MKDLTNIQKQELLGKIKSFLSITWVDTKTDTELTDYMLRSINRIDEVAGAELDYLATAEDADEDPLYNKMSTLAQELLLNRVFYMKEKALDDFEANYNQELNSLYLMGRIRKSQDAEQQ